MKRLRGPAVLGVLAAFLLAAGCAKKAPPSGGPPDLTPPTLASANPDSGAAGVATDAALSLTFSEGMEPRSTGEAVSIAPRVPIKRRRWSGRTLTIELAESLKAGHTYTLFVAAGARDLHGNDLAGGATVVFSTAAAFPRGRIEGTIEARGFDPIGTAIWCYDAATNREPDSTARDFDAIGIADAKGRFRVDGLAVPGRYRLWAFVDGNGNHSFEPDADLLVPADTVVALQPDSEVAGPLLVHVTNPRAPARLSGAVLDSLADSVGVVRLLVTSATDSTRRQLQEVDRKGGFDFPLTAGKWRLQAFRDLDKNRVVDETKEPASEVLELDVLPADEIKDLVLVLRRARGVP